MDSLNSYINKGRLIIFNATAIVGIIGYVIDIINFSKTSDIIIYNNILLILITISAFILFHLKKLNLKISFAIIVYSAFINVIFYSFVNISSEYNLYFFLRDSVFLILILTLASLISSKYHALIMAAIFIVFTFVFNLIFKNDFLQSSLIMFLLFVSTYSLVVYFFVDILEKSIDKHDKNQKMIYEQNDSLNEVNVLLEERQQTIEEQAEELKSANEQLHIINEELIELNAMKNKFFSIIGHDLKNPIGAILGFSEILKIKTNKLSHEKRNMYIENIFSSAQKTYNLLKNLLDWARSQSGRMVINPENINLTQLIESNISLLKERKREKKIKILSEFPENPAFVFCDINMADAVIRNLLGNAIKFTNPLGEISVKVMIDKKQEQVITVISDTGMGIPTDELNKLFSLNRNYSTQGTEGESGTGLGLILCKEFIERNKGQIWVESELGKGSIFSFTLPLIKMN